MGNLERQGIECLPLDLLQAKERLRFDSEKMQFTDVTQENGDADGADAPPDGPRTGKSDANERQSEPQALPPGLLERSDADERQSEPQALPPGLLEESAADEDSQNLKHYHLGPIMIICQTIHRHWEVKRT